MEILGDWLNNNQGVVAVMIFSVGLLVSLIIWLIKSLFSKQKKENKPAIEKSPNKELIKARRDIKADRDIIGEQHNVTNYTYSKTSSQNKDQPIIEVKIDTFSSIQARTLLTLAFRNIGNSPGILYGLQLGDEQLRIGHISLPPHGNWVKRTFEVTASKILLEKNDNATLEVTYKNIYNERGRTIAKIIQKPRADNLFNIGGLEIEEYHTPDKEQSKEGSMILLGSLYSDDWEREF